MQKVSGGMPDHSGGMHICGWVMAEKWHRRFMWILPKETKQFLIMRDKENLLACRNENREDPDFAFRLEMYNRLADKKDKIIIVDNNKTIDQAVNCVVDDFVVKKRV